MKCFESVKETAKWTLQLGELISLISLELCGLYYLYKALGLIA